MTYKLYGKKILEKKLKKRPGPGVYNSKTETIKKQCHHSQ